MSQNGIDGMELLLILSQRKMTILKVTLAVAVIAAIVMFLIPNTYTATATILPPEEKQSSLGAMLGQLGSIAGLSEIRPWTQESRGPVHPACCTAGRFRIN